MKNTLNKILTIALREFQSSYRTPLAWMVTGGFLLLSGFFFFGRLQWFNGALNQAAMLRESVPTLNEQVVAPYFQTIELILVFLIPILAMRAIAEERKSGTFELLITSPLSVFDLVIGKFLGLSLVLFFMLAVSFVFPLSLLFFASLEFAPVLIGILGLFVFALSFLAISLAVSSVAKSMTVAALVGVIVSLILYAINLPASGLSGNLTELLNYLSPPMHSMEFYRGVISSSDVIYFFSLIALGLFAAQRALDAGRWRA